MKPGAVDGKRVRFQLGATSRLCPTGVAPRSRRRRSVQDEKLSRLFGSDARRNFETMSRVYSWGESLGYVSSDSVFAGSKGSFSNKRKETFVTMEACRRLIDGCDDAELRVLSAFYRIGGLRLGEAFEARWERRRLARRAFYRSVAEDGAAARIAELSRCFELRRELGRCVRKAAPTILSSASAPDKQSVYNAIRNTKVFASRSEYRFGRVWFKICERAGRTKFTASQRGRESRRDRPRGYDGTWRHCPFVDDDLAKALSKS